MASSGAAHPSTTSRSTRPRFETPRPLGFATESVLREFGYSDREIDELNEKGVTTAVGHGLPA